MTTSIKKITALKFWVRIVVEKDGEGFYSYTPSLKGIHMGGDTPEEAFDNTREAAMLYLKSMLKHGDPIPIDVLEPNVTAKLSRSKDIVISRVEEIKIKI